MPLEKKKKSKTKKLKGTDKTKVKAEPTELKPLVNFIDDRVELIRQTFMCLKTKTVKQIAPDFLQGKSIEKIQEYCLDEVLGISKKRLTSIINNVKCPTDTESSDSDNSDVQKIDGHISLEEISSDSDDGARKKAKKTTKTAPKAAAATDKPEKNGNEEKNTKEMTVLELLELQARARAIRSQLAQEPVTKIELKSDSDDIEQPSSSATTGPAAKRKKKTKSTDAPPKSQPGPTATGTSAGKPVPPKRVKLKRNFRKREVGDEDSDQEEQEPQQQQTEIDPKATENGKEKSPPKEVEPPQETQDRSRDSSPEVVPLVPSPEVLCLSSESEGEAAEALARRKKEREKSAIFRTDYLESLEQKSKEYIDSLKKKNSKESMPVIEPIVAPVEEAPPEDPEEGEISEEDKPAAETPTDDLSKDVDEIVEENRSSEKRRSDSSACLSVGLDNEELDYDKEDSDKESSRQPPRTESQPEVQKPTKANIEDEHHSSMSGSSESESSSSESEAEEEVVAPKTVEAKQPEEDEEEDLDTIEIHDSSDDGLCESKLSSKDDENEESSWNTRYLRSSKVQKIIATSKLANKVRGKMKKKKAKLVDVGETIVESQSPIANEAPQKPVESEHEVGSMQHYQEILADAEQENASSSNPGETN